MHALIIEDESVIAMVIEDILRECGFTSFDFASSPQAALDAAASQSPDLITSDVQLKPGCGIATVQTIRSGLAVPVIFITGNAGDVTRRMPGFPVLSKPFSQAALSTAVAAALG